MRAVGLEALRAWVAPAVLWSVLTGPALADDLRRVALVVGNAAYEHDAALRNPGNDATDMAAALEALDFQVVQGRDVDRDGFFDKLDEFAEAALGADVALFFYAGHGLQVDGRNYLVPVDARLKKKLHLRREAIDLDTVMSEMRSRTNLVFLDACRNNPLADNLARSMGGSRSVGATRGLARAEDRSGTLIAYATAEGTVAEDGEGEKNSPFTAALLEHIGIRGMSIFQMVNEVAQSVKDRTAGRQVPWFHFSALPNSFPLLPESSRVVDDLFEVSEVDRVMRVSEPSNARRGPGTTYTRVGSLRAGDKVTVTGEVEDKPWVRVRDAGRCGGLCPRGAVERAGARESPRRVPHGRRIGRTAHPRRPPEGNRRGSNFRRRNPRLRDCGRRMLRRREDGGQPAHLARRNRELLPMTHGLVAMSGVGNAQEVARRGITALLAVAVLWSAPAAAQGEHPRGGSSHGADIARDGFAAARDGSEAAGDGSGVARAEPEVAGGGRLRARSSARRARRGGWGSGFATVMRRGVRSWWWFRRGAT